MEHRRTRRFKLQLPLSVVRTGAERVAFLGKTKDISSSGVLFTTNTEPDPSNSSIEYVITLNQEGTQAVNLRCVGKVVRCEKESAVYEENPFAYQVAATLERYEFVREQ